MASCCRRARRLEFSARIKPGDRGEHAAELRATKHSPDDGIMPNSHETGNDYQ